MEKDAGDNPVDDSLVSWGWLNRCPLLEIEVSELLEPFTTVYFWPYSKMSLCLSLSGKFDTPHTLLMNWSKKIQPRTQTWSRLVIGNFRFRPTMTMDFQLLCIYVPKIRFQYFQVSLLRTTLDQRHPDWKNFHLLFRFDKYLKLIKTNKACTTCH